MSTKKFYGDGLPGVHLEELQGQLIVIEGADGSGRSTQIAMLKEWLERKGYAIVDTGLKRSTLVSEDLQTAKQGNILTHTTMSLFYATDFADQLENKIIPALRAGFIVLADRYIYTLMTRDIVRGADPEWVRSLYGIALIPDIIFYLRVSPKQLVERNFQKNATLDYWESGMDCGLSRDMFDSFIKYQRLMQAEFKHMETEYGFEVIDGNRSRRAICNEIEAKIEAILGAA
jgi:dTMP kinase